MRKIPQKYENLIFSLSMSLIMCTVMSFAMTWIFTGFFTEGFMQRWLMAFGYALIIATPTVLFVNPLVRRAVGQMVNKS